MLTLDPEKGVHQSETRKGGNSDRADSNGMWSVTIPTLLPRADLRGGRKITICFRLIRRKSFDPKGIRDVKRAIVPIEGHIRAGSCIPTSFWI